MDIQPVRRRALALALALGIALAARAGPVAADGVLVICNPGITLLPVDVRDVFIGEKSFAGAVKLEPADNSAAQAAFLVKVLKVDAAKYAGIWTKKSFRDGATPPPVKNSDAEAIAYTKRTPGACSYISTEPGPGVILIGRF